MNLFMVDDLVAPNVKNYSYAIVDGQVYYRENSRMVLSGTAASI